jgi:tetratricopeptide (TPR) repeat protein
MASDVDLPAIVGPSPVGLGAPTKKSDLGAFDDFGDLGVELDASPAHSPLSDLEIDLPARVGGGFPGGIELDEIADLPAPVIHRDPRERDREPRHDSDEVDLPVIGGGGHAMPALKSPPAMTGGGFGDLDLPMIAPPDARDLDLPAAQLTDLPNVAGPGGFGELDLPTVGSELPALGGGFDLPSTSQGGIGLPDSLASLPAPAASLPSPAAGLPTSAAGLPTSAAGLPTQAGHLPQIAAGVPTLHGPGPGLPAPGPPSRGVSPVSFDPSAPQEDPAIVRQLGGGTNFGEVNLDGSDGGPALEADVGGGPPRGDDMEFAGIPQEGGAMPVGPAVEVRRAPVAQPRALVDLPPPRKRSMRAVFAAIVVLLLGGASLALVPSIGPYGVYFVWDKVKGGDYERTLSNTAKASQELLSTDSFPDATKAYEQAENTRNANKRIRGLRAYVVFVAYLREVRFGADPAVSARAQVLLDEFKEEDDAAVPFLGAARAAQAAATGQIPRARSGLDKLLRAKSNDSNLLALRGEVELHAREPKAALEAWAKAETQEHSARTSYGMARAQLASGDKKETEKLARETLTRNPNHAGARVLIARVTWNAGGESSAVKLLDEVIGQKDKSSPTELVTALTLLGDIHLARSRVTHAEGSYSEALKIDPKAAQALVGLGDALYRSGRFSEGLGRFEAAVQADPDELNAKVGVAKAMLALERVQDATAAMTKLRETHPQSALVAYWFAKVQEAAANRKLSEDAYRQALKMPNPDMDVAQIYVGLAFLMNQLGRTEDAQKVLAEARKKLPDSASIHVALGDLALSQGRYGDAVTELQMALKIDPGDIGAQFKLGVAFRRDRKFEDASKMFEKVAAIDRDYPGLALERGLLFEASGHTEEALKAYEAALAKAPNDPDLMLRVGCGKVAAGRAKEAAELLRKVLEKRQGSAETHHCLGRALLLQGTNLAEALKTLEQAAALDSNRAEYHLYVGWAAIEAGKIGQAETSIKKALELDQGLGDAYWQRGVLRQRQGAVRDAVKDLQKALELRPSRVEAHAALADAYYDLGREADALHEWQVAIEGQPDNPTWRFRYGRLLAANHQAGEAQAQLAKAIDLAEALEVKPTWLAEAHLDLARSIGVKKEAAKHWEAYLRLGRTDSPYRAEAKKALAEMGRPWDGN